jgi:hypothetical protein
MNNSIAGVPIFVSQFMAEDTAYLMDMDVPNIPCPYIVTDKIETVQKAIKEWEEVIDRMFLKRLGIKL